MKYICDDCKTIFTEDEIKVERQCDGYCHGHPVYIDVEQGCPNCGCSRYDEYREDEEVEQ